MMCWSRGRLALLDHLKINNMSIGSYISSVSHLDRVPGTAVFLTRRQGIATLAMLHILKHFKVLHKRNIVVHVETEHEPRIAKKDRVTVRDLGDGFWAIEIRYGFMEHPNLPKVLENCLLDGQGIEMMKTTFFLSRETIARSRNSPLGLLAHFIYEFLHRNAGDASAFFRIPPDRLVELGACLEI
jgi:KUP system potassium uptake protein